MASKTFLLFGLLVTVLLITSHVTARELVETSTEKNGDVAKNPDQYGGGYNGGGGGYNGGRGGYNGGRGGCCGGGGGSHHGGGGRGGGYCRYGCCYKGHYGGCSRCCAYAGEVAQTEPENKPETKPIH